MHVLAVWVRFAFVLVEFPDRNLSPVSVGFDQVGAATREIPDAPIPIGDGIRAAESDHDLVRNPVLLELRSGAAEAPSGPGPHSGRPVCSWALRTLMCLWSLAPLEAAADAGRFGGRRSDTVK